MTLTPRRARSLPSKLSDWRFSVSDTIEEKREKKETRRLAVCNIWSSSRLRAAAYIGPKGVIREGRYTASQQYLQGQRQLGSTVEISHCSSSRARQRALPPLFGAIGTRGGAEHTFSIHSGHKCRCISPDMSRNLVWPQGSDSETKAATKTKTTHLQPRQCFQSEPVAMATASQSSQW